MIMLAWVNLFMFLFTAYLAAQIPKVCCTRYLCFITNITAYGSFGLLCLGLSLYCLRSYLRADIDSADILIFDNHLNLLTYFYWAPLYMLASHLLILTVCGTPAFGHHTLLSFSGLGLLEIVFIRLYTKWHQTFIKQQEGFCF